MRVALIAARSENNVIGRNGAMPWHLPADLKHFKQLTTGHTIIMGRKTFESVGRALPNRVTLVVTRDPDYQPDGVTIANSPEEAFELAERGSGGPDDPENLVFVCGGAEIYRAALSRAERMYLTRVHTITDGDVLFPDFPDDEWERASRQRHAADEKNDLDYTFEVWERVGG